MVIIMASFQTCDSWPSSHILLIHRCSLLDKMAPPYFHTSAGIPSPPGALLSFTPLIALTISSIVDFPSRAVWTLCCCMFSSASGSMSAGTLSNFWKYSLNLAICEGLHPIRWFSIYMLFLHWTHASFNPLYKPFMSLMSTALFSSSSFISHHLDFRARVYF